MNTQQLLIGALVGLLATIAMDIGSLIGFFVVSRLSLITPGPKPAGHHLIGRWFLYLLRGKASHNSILDSPPLRRELPVGVLVHYLIGAFLAVIYFTLLQLLNTVPTLLNALVFGIGTTVLPWFYLYPAWGYGRLGAKAKGTPLTYLSLYNHTLYGLGLALGATLLSPS
jgi:hypothetical protein